MYLERKKEGGGRERKREERRVHNRKKREKSLQIIEEFVTQERSFRTWRK